jgi:cobalt-zinc-cadmium efflux system membrane fusion protein
VKESSGVVPAVRLREAEAAVQEARIRVDSAYQALLNLGIPVRESEWRGLSSEKLKAELRFAGVPAAVARTLPPDAPSTLLPIVAPQDGTVVSFEIVAGEVTDSNRVLFEVVDTRRLWITFDAKVEDARRLRIGLPVRYRPDGEAAEVASTLTWVSTQADPKTRTVKLRAELPDPDGRLRANTFGSGRILLRQEPRAVVVPTAAVHWEGCCHVVFVRDKDFQKPDAPKVFHTRSVRVGAKDETTTEIIAGVLPGELVVTKGSGVLRAELLRGNLGEG